MTVRAISSRFAYWPWVTATHTLQGGRYLRGLTWGRVGLVLLLCTVFAARQVATCYADPRPCTIDYGSVEGLARFLGRHLLAAMPMLFAVTIADNLTARASNRVRIVGFASAVVVGALGFALVFQFTVAAPVRAADLGRAPMYMLTFFSRAALYGGMATAMLYLFARERADRWVLHEARLAKLALDRQMIEARLQALQAQIEPHFLFNTLANIKLLYEVDPREAKPLIHSLAAYLSAALPRMRGTGSTLGRELAMVNAYLSVFKVRMGDRLTPDIDVPVELESAALPPMMVLTLVENAVKHGLNPRLEGGTIRIRAKRDGDILRVTVEDDGAGFAKSKGSGVGLANIRARLAALYGTAGQLTLDTNRSGGVTASIELPYAGCTSAESTP